MRRQRTFIGFIALVMMMVMILPVSADQLSDQQKLLDSLNKRMEATQKNLNQASRAEKTILGEVQGIEENAERTQKEIDELTSNIARLQGRIATLNKEIKIHQDELDKQVAILGERLVVIYEQRDISYLEVLLGSTDIKDLITRMDMLGTIIDQDKELIEEINLRKKELDNKKADLDVQQRELESARVTLVEKKAKLAEQLKQKKKTLSSVQQEQAKYAQAMKELEQASAEAEAMILKLQGKGGSIGTGTYTWPTPGYTTITSAYGMRYHPILKVNKLHTGIDIGAPSGAKIVAADSGKVIYSGWLGAYGNTVIVDHGAGLSTLYGHLSARQVEVGARVSKGQMIGKVGSTGWSTGPHLHFEVRKNGNPINPRSYI
ncbi:MAG: peptidoglycan DD-metalloendopeptidase family protein [Syntrophomonadaceae bacterium]|nr:peptidoglycan DD-metalloendopeptidase family protein [Syntrophomonadaceae bacterium]